MANVGVKDFSLEQSASGEPTNTEKDLLRYYYYIHNGIDTEHVAPLETIRIQNVMLLIADELKNNYAQSLSDLSDEIREDYLLSVKKAIVDFVLRDSKEAEFSVSGGGSGDKANKANKVPEYKQELSVVPKPWNGSFEKARAEMAKNLHAINPCMSQVLKLWYTSFK